MVLSSFYTPATCQIFLSSGDDAHDLRDLVNDLVDDAVNPQLRRANMPYQLAVERWELEAAERNAPGEDGNARFVALAKASTVTLCLLIERLGAGTKEEIEAVLDDTEDVDLAVLWFVPITGWPMSDVGTFLDSRKAEIHIDRAGPPDGPGAVVAIVKLLFKHVLKLMQPPPEERRERR